MAEDSSRQLTGAVVVVGGGIAGVQAALDLAESGFRVYVIEKEPAIGGRMAQLDKTFPTNDCAICTLAPRLVTAAAHPNIRLVTGSELVGLNGEHGHFRVRIRRRTRYVDTDKCTGCGDCARACLAETGNRFDLGLGRRKAVFQLYSQAVPAAFAIDPRACIECCECLEACQAGAINYRMGDREFEIEAGAVILSPGYAFFEGELLKDYGYGRCANVVTGLQLERMLSASGPSGGEVYRPSDGKRPQRIAFIQCVGSRDRAHGNEYCSSVCCMHTTKQALLVRQHDPDVEVSVFYLDIRAYGKGYEAFFERVVQSGIRYVRSSVARVWEQRQGRTLRVRYHVPGSGYIEEDFDLAVLAVGLVPPEGSRRLARLCNIELDSHGFCLVSPYDPVQTSRPGVFACGAFCGPKDIPETVVEASAAAAGASRLLKDVRGQLAVEQRFPPEREVEGQAPRIGVFVCRCGNNIGGTINVPEVVDYAGTLDGVAYTREFSFACARDSVNSIVGLTGEFGLNRVVVAACTPRTHEPLFQQALREAGLNPHLYEHVNIREHAAWVHTHQPEAATAKARELVQMGVAKARLLRPLTPVRLEVDRRVLVVGGGAAGMSAALAVADQGIPVVLVERSPELGGHLRNLRFTLDGADPRVLLLQLVERVSQHPLVETRLSARLLEVSGHTGRWRTRIIQEDVITEIEHGAVIVATGADAFRPSAHGYGPDQRVLTQTELEARLADDRLTPPRRVIMLQCVGSRTPERPYCSRVCCGQAVKNALLLRELSPGSEVVVLYRDMRTYGLQETLYRKAREEGVLFLGYEPDGAPEVEARGGELVVSFVDRSLNERVALATDLVVLSAGIVPNRQVNTELGRMFKLGLHPDGFFAEAHLKLKPVDFATDGVFLCGLAHGPKLLRESLVQAQAAAMRAVAFLARGFVEGSAAVTRVDRERCSGCGLCVESCPFGGRVLDREAGFVRVIEAACQGCGACVAACPAGACDQDKFEDRQIIAMIEAAFK